MEAFYTELLNLLQIYILISNTDTDTHRPSTLRGEKSRPFATDSTEFFLRANLPPDLVPPHPTPPIPLHHLMGFC